jgi:hypothetical protein
MCNLAFLKLLLKCFVLIVYYKYFKLVLNKFILVSA